LIPQGRTAARTSRGSFAEKFDEKNWREVPYNYAMGPLTTNGDWYNYIKRIAAEDRSLVEGRMPLNWDFDFFDSTVHRSSYFPTKDGQPIDWKAPVSSITRPMALQFLEDLTKFLKEQGYDIEGDVRFPTLYEWRRAFRPDP